MACENTERKQRWREREREARRRYVVGGEEKKPSKMVAGIRGGGCEICHLASCGLGYNINMCFFFLFFCFLIFFFFVFFFLDAGLVNEAWQVSRQVRERIVVENVVANGQEV